ncbi:MAG: chloramphenicol phosphotransferase CPT family protein [Silvanigrellaceae bacterium]|nr:chloramphenicol phosphotransferase CPT family protein [Silvanigrellaceae bacterium]
MQVNNNKNIPPSTATRCIILNGTSSSGKTSVAKALQLEMPNLLHLQIDSIGDLYFGMFPPGYDDSFTDKWEEPTFRCRKQITEIFLKCALTMMKSGYNLCLDTILDGPDSIENMNYYLETLIEYTPIFIGVLCDLSITEVREKQRGNRRIGLSREQIEGGMHKNCSYAFTIDTSYTSPFENAKIILSKIEKQER